MCLQSVEEKKTEVRAQSLGLGSQVLDCLSSMQINQGGVRKPGVLPTRTIQGYRASLMPDWEEEMLSQKELEATVCSHIVPDTGFQILPPTNY